MMIFTLLLHAFYGLRGIAHFELDHFFELAYIFLIAVYAVDLPVVLLNQLLAVRYDSIALLVYLTYFRNVLVVVCLYYTHDIVLLLFEFLLDRVDVRIRLRHELLIKSEINTLQPFNFFFVLLNLLAKLFHQRGSCGAVALVSIR